MASGGIISKEMDRIFQGIRKVIDEDGEQDWAHNTALGHSSLERERRREYPVKSYMLIPGVEEASHPREEVALDSVSRDFGEIKAGCQTESNTRDTSKETFLISCLRLRASFHCWESRSNTSRAECLKPNW